MAKSDYYEVLGVPRDADTETIRRAFHAAAREFHPDVSESADAERRFRELAEAYAVLSKAGSRLLYDRYGYRGRGNSGFEEALWEARGASVRGESVRVELELLHFEAESGARKLVQFESAAVCPDCEGHGTKLAPDPDCSVCGGTGRRCQISHNEAGRLLSLDTCPECAGEVCPACDGSGRVRELRRLRLVIPAGVEDGSQLRVGGEGEPPVNGGLPGDLLVDVRVRPAPRDPRIVRYFAAVLFLAALVALLVYLFS